MVGLGLAISTCVSVIVNFCSCHHCWVSVSPSFASWRLFFYLQAAAAALLGICSSLYQVIHVSRSRSHSPIPKLTNYWLGS
ncbi:hypothetical protein BDW69DRAFT_63337 [Aspergillus filifer]